MSIDGISKRSGAVPGATVPGAAPASETPFELGASEASGAIESAAPGSDALAALERGEISVADYLDARVEGAVLPLLSRLSSEQLDFVRQGLRSALETDPVLVELVRRTTSGVSGR
jgi:hypothetical protein